MVDDCSEKMRKPFADSNTYVIVTPLFGKEGEGRLCDSFSTESPFSPFSQGGKLLPSSGKGTRQLWIHENHDDDEERHNNAIKIGGLLNKISIDPQKRIQYNLRRSKDVQDQTDNDVPCEGHIKGDMTDRK